MIDIEIYIIGGCAYDEPIATKTPPLLRPYNRREPLQWPENFNESRSIR